MRDKKSWINHIVNSDFANYQLFRAYTQIHKMNHVLSVS